MINRRDAKPVKPPSTSFNLFASEHESNSKCKDGNLETKMSQWSASWNALSKEEKKVYQERVIFVSILIFFFILINIFQSLITIILMRLAETGIQQEFLCLPC